MTENCSQCGDAIPAEEWHPVVTRRPDDETVEIHDFCDEACRTAWKAEQSEEPEWPQEEREANGEQIINQSDI